MAPIQYIAVPVGTAGGPEWRGVIARHSEAGYKIFWCASVLAELAAKADQGGLLAFASGQPKTALDLCGELGVEAAWAAETLFPALERLGEGHWREEEGAWVCTSPMILRTLEWRGDVVATKAKALPAPKNSGKLQFSVKLSESEYKAWQRSCKLPVGVHLTKPCPKRAKGGVKSCQVLSGRLSVCPNLCPDLSVLCPDSENGHKRTDKAEDSDIVDNIECPFSPQQNTNKREVKKQQQEAKPDTPVVVLNHSHQKTAKDLLNTLPSPERSAALASLLAQCLSKGATDKDLLRKINKAKSKNPLQPGKYLWKDLTAYSGGSDWDAASKEAERQKAEQKESYEAHKREETERQEQEREVDRKELLARQKRFFSLPDPERQLLEDQARRWLTECNWPDINMHSVVSRALDILDGLVTLQPQDNIGIYA